MEIKNLWWQKRHHLFPLSKRWRLHVWHLHLELCPCQSGTVPQALWWTVDWFIPTHTTDFWDFHQQPPNEEEANSGKKWCVGPVLGGSMFEMLRERTPTANLMVRSRVPDEVELVPAGLTFSDFQSKYLQHLFPFPVTLTIPDSCLFVFCFTWTQITNFVS